MSDKPNLLWFSDSPFFNTGYSTQSLHICNALSEKYNVHYLANGYNGQKIPNGLKLEGDTTFKFTIHPQGRQAYGQDVIKLLLYELRPKYFITLLDTFMVYPWYITYDFSPAMAGFYFPSDGGGRLPLNCEQILARMQYPIAMSKFAQKQVLDVHGLSVGYIPHGVDTELYKPLSDVEKRDAKQKYNVSNSFVVGCVSRNQGRKKLDGLLKGFAMFARSVPNAKLLLHTDPEDQSAVFNMNELIQRLNIGNRVVFTGMKYYKGFSYSEMPNVYAAMDVFCLPTTGEGFGVPTIEAMSCEIPVMVTDYTTTQELLIDDGVCGWPIPYSFEITGSWNVERAMPTEHDVSKTLLKAYSERDKFVSMGKVGREKCLKFYDWKVVGENWIKILK